MPVTDYPELQGMPAGCTTSSPWGYTAIPVLVPYGQVQDVVVQLQPLISTDMWEHPLFSNEAAYSTDEPPEGLGYESEMEIGALDRLRAIAVDVANGGYGYHSDARDDIVRLAAHANNLLDKVQRDYTQFHNDGGNIKYQLKPAGNRPSVWRGLPLSVTRDQFLSVVDVSGDTVGYLEHRAEVRQKIKNQYHKAIHLLWCALYGVAQSESWRGNKEIYDASVGAGLPDGGVSFPSGGPPPPSPSAAVLFGDATIGPRVPTPPDPPPPPPPPPQGYPGDDDEYPEGDGDSGDDEYPEGDNLPAPPGGPPPLPLPTPKKKASGGAGMAVAVAVAVVAVLMLKR